MELFSQLTPRLNFLQRHSSCCCWRRCWCWWGSGLSCLSALFAVYFDCLGCGGCQLIQLRDARNLSRHRMSPPCRSLHFTGPGRVCPCLLKIEEGEHSKHSPHEQIISVQFACAPPEGESVNVMFGVRIEREKAEPAAGVGLC